MLVNRSLVSPQNLLPTGSSVCSLSPVPSHDISSLQGLVCQQSARGVQPGSSPKASQESPPTAAASIQDSAQIPTHINLQNDTESQAKRAKKGAEATKPADQRDNFALARVEAPATASPVLILVIFSD